LPTGRLGLVQDAANSALFSGHDSSSHGHSKSVTNVTGG
jgi:hypothetical protein